jgi:hypothetical protein
MAKKILCTGKTNEVGMVIIVENDLWGDAAIVLMDQGFTNITVKKGEEVTVLEAR